MNDIKDYFIHQNLPESLNRQNAKEIAQVVDEFLHRFDGQIPQVLIYPVIDQLPENLVDALAVQLHCDFYDYSLSLAAKRHIVKNSIAWHRIKGTPGAVEILCQSLFHESRTKEWYEYGGRPYFFRMVMDISDGSEDASREIIKLLKKAIEAGKNVRSWLELLEFIVNMEDTEQVGESFISDVSLYYHDLIPYGTNTTPIYTRNGTIAHGHAARHNGHFLHGGRGMDKLFPRILPPIHLGREDISTDRLDYWPVWIGKDMVPLRETLPEDLGMSLAIAEAMSQPLDKLAMPISMEFHDAFPYGTEKEVLSHDGTLRHGFSFKRRGLFLHGGRGRHGWPPMGLDAHGCKYDLDHDRLSVYAISCSFKDEVKPKESEHNDIALQVSSDRVPTPQEGDMPLEAGLILRHDNSVRHNGRYVRGVNPCRAGEFEIIRERRDGRFARGGSVRHRDSPVAAFA